MERGVGKDFSAFKKTLNLLEARIKKEIGTQKKSSVYLKGYLDRLWSIYREIDERLCDTEVQVNLLTRLLTALALENLSIDLKDFRNLIKRMEKDLRDDTEISHLILRNQLINISV